MPRQTIERIKKSPNLVHVEVLRNGSGTVQMSSVGSNSTTAGTTGATTTVSGPSDLVAFENLTVTASADAAATTPITGTVSRNGSSVGTFSIAATGQQTTTVTTRNTLTTPANAPTWTLNATVASNSTPVNLSVSREQRLE